MFDEGHIVAASKKRKPPSADYLTAIKEHTKALRQHTRAMNGLAKVIASAPTLSDTALDDHTIALNAFVTSSKALFIGKTISRGTILARLAQKWGKPAASIKKVDPIGKYIQGGPGVMSAYAAELNRSPEFAPDGLNLRTNDTAFVTTVDELVTAIANGYIRNGWHVTP
jgi:hypothetical protein